MAKEKMGGESRLNEVHGAVYTNSLREGPAWLGRLYDERKPAYKPVKHRVIKGRFGQGQEA